MPHETLKTMFGICSVQKIRKTFTLCEVFQIIFIIFQKITIYGSRAQFEKFCSQCYYYSFTSRIRLLILYNKNKVLRNEYIPVENISFLSILIWNVRCSPNILWFCYFAAKVNTCLSRWGPVDFGSLLSFT